jgi:hypothetical protein
MLGIGLLGISLFISDRSAVYYIGILDRIVFGIFFIFNGLWNCITGYYSIVNYKVQADKTAPKWPWLLIIVIGMGMFITAFMGYGFNNVSKP